jgi:hypothetical protein
LIAGQTPAEHRADAFHATAEAFADTLFVHGGDGGARIIKDATNAVTATMPPFVQDQLGVSVLPPSGAGQAPGPKDTIEVLRRLVAGGFGGAWRNVLTDLRIRRIPRTEWRSRFDHFRF